MEQKVEIEISMKSGLIAYVDLWPNLWFAMYTSVLLQHVGKHGVSFLGLNYFI